ncbi:hypothetical protein BX600DRAFT_552582 [Xylariales sp. PMI_506]|nr:hypothetical protein BX600DRAFT_552582 [Xylariales sp. PMI_506]
MVASRFNQGLALISCVWLARSVDVSLDFYSSTDCKTPSTITPSAALNLSICVATPGLVSLYYETVPCAGGGIVIPYLFGDTSCGSQQTILDVYKTGSDYHCLSDFASDSIAAVMLSCSQTQPEQPQGTSIVSVAQVATASIASTTPTASTTSATSSSENTTNDVQNIQAGWNNLSLGAQIGIIVAAAVAVIGMIGICLLCWRRCRSLDQQYFQNVALPRPAWRAPHAPTQRFTSPHPPQQPWELYGRGVPPINNVLPPTYPFHELPGSSPNAAYQQVLKSVIETARHNAASGYFDGNIDANDILNPALSPQAMSSAFSEREEERNRQVGAAGELYVFEYLRSIGLPNFGPQNWTSSLRTLCNAHPEFRDLGTSKDGIADFEYFDENGVFTNFLLDRNISIRGIHRGIRPKYQFEVKSTMSPNSQTKFYVTRNQEIHIRKALITPSQIDQVYIIFRISSLGQGSRTRLDIYVDPEAWRREGRLRFTQSADGWTVQPR